MCDAEKKYELLREALKTLYLRVHYSSSVEGYLPDFWANVRELAGITPQEVEEALNPKVCHEKYHYRKAVGPINRLEDHTTSCIRLKDHFGPHWNRLREFTWPNKIPAMVSSEESHRLLSTFKESYPDVSRYQHQRQDARHTLKHGEQFAHTKVESTIGPCDKTVLQVWGPNQKISPMKLDCALNKGHEGPCSAGGHCYKHGPYLGIQCPHALLDGCTTAIPLMPGLKW